MKVVAESHTSEAFVIEMQLPCKLTLLPCVQDSYSSLMPLYFPRNPQEELYAAQRLPLDVGNEDGEPVIAERKIRIAAGPTVGKYHGIMTLTSHLFGPYNEDVTPALSCFILERNTFV